jgi:hypothetical protein
LLKNKTKIILTLSLVFTLLSLKSFTQEYPIPSCFNMFFNVDSIIKNSKEYVVFFNEIHIYPEKEFKNRRERNKYNKLVRNFKKVYPYALEIGEIYKNIDDTLNMFDDDKTRKKYIKYREKQIMDTYKPKLTKMTLSQGVLLVKLLDRETGNTAYEIVDDLRGTIKAFFWQGFALLFGNNLKYHYDGDNQDKEIEELVMRFNEGTLY